jgi:hypothetical protein
MTNQSERNMNPRPFMDFLREHRTGITHDMLSDALQELVAAVTQEGKAGKLVLTIGVKPLGKNDGLEVSAMVECKPPKETAGTAIFFPTPDNNLVRQDPRQQAMELREITPASAHKGVA